MAKKRPIDESQSSQIGTWQESTNVELNRGRRRTGSTPSRSSRSSRLQPSVPMHMTTRGSQKAASQGSISASVSASASASVSGSTSASASVSGSNGSQPNSAAPSVVDVGASTEESQHQPKRRRFRSNSAAPHPDAAVSPKLPASDELPSQSLPPRRRLRSNSVTTPPVTADSATPPLPSDAAARIVRAQTQAPSQAASNTSSTKRKRVAMDTGVSILPEAPPAVAAAETSLQAEKAVDAPQPAPKKRRGRRPKAALDAAVIEEAGSTVAAVDPTELVIAPPAVKRPPGRPRGAKTSKTSKAPVAAPTPSGPRLPGRRRAPHADPVVEALLVRQGDLKRNYRTVAKAMKPALAVLSDRTSALLEEDEQAHKKAALFEAVQAELDARLAERLDDLDREYRLKRDNAVVKLAAECAVARRNCDRKVEESQEDLVLYCKQEFLQVLRDLKLHRDGEATEDEDQDDAPPEKRRGPKSGASRAFDLMETERQWAALEARLRCNQVLQSCAPEVVNESPGNVATADRRARMAAVAAYNLESLFFAAEEVEEQGPEASPTVLFNGQKVGLQPLLDAIDVREPVPRVTVATPSQAFVAAATRPAADHDMSPHRGNLIVNYDAAMFTYPSAGPSRQPATQPEIRPKTSKKSKGTASSGSPGASRDSASGNDAPRTPTARGEPAVGLFLAPTSSPAAATPPSKSAASTTASSLRPAGRQTRRESPSARRTTTKSRALAPKGRGNGSPPAPVTGTNPLASILNVDGPSDLPPSSLTSHPGTSTAPLPGARVQEASSPIPWAQGVDHAKTFTPVQYDGYEQPTPSAAHYSPTLPPPPPYPTFSPSPYRSSSTQGSPMAPPPPFHAYALAHASRTVAGPGYGHARNGVHGGPNVGYGSPHLGATRSAPQVSLYSPPGPAYHTLGSYPPMMVHASQEMPPSMPPSMPPPPPPPVFPPQAPGGFMSTQTPANPVPVLPSLSDPASFPYPPRPNLESRQ
ncbi:MAG: hypothetical protein M1838_003773 [Thelocarpon superellum]|nr:MAG: hypothetical protein M1838_003773 [Thelocarpon superellum]